MHSRKPTAWLSAGIEVRSRTPVAERCFCLTSDVARKGKNREPGLQEKSVRVFTARQTCTGHFLFVFFLHIRQLYLFATFPIVVLLKNKNVIVCLSLRRLIPHGDIYGNFFYHLSRFIFCNITNCGNGPYTAF